MSRRAGTVTRREEEKGGFTIFPSERVARDTDIDNKVLYAATNRSPVRGFEPPPAAFTVYCHRYGRSRA